MDPKEAETRHLEFCRKHFAQNVAGVVAGLHALAETIERDAARRAADPLLVAANVQHEVLWGIANLHLDGLTTSATEYERAKAEQ